MRRGFRGERRFRWTENRRARVLEVLGATGNATAAAEAVGAGWSSLAWLRKKDSEFDRQCLAAVAAADERLKGAKDAFAEGDGFHAIQRTSNGRYQLTAVREGCWTKRDEELFFTHLRRTGNIAASARAAGFDESSVWERLRKWPAFERRWEEVLDEASLALEFRLACEGNQMRLTPAGDSRHSRESGDPEGLSTRSRAAGDPRLDSRFRGNDGEDRGNDGEGRGEPGEAQPFDREFALRFLKWREERKAGKRRGRPPKRPPIEEVAENIIRKVEAIKRHRKRRDGEGEAA